MASKYLRGNCLGMLPSTCRKPICLRLLEVLSYSCAPAAPTQDQALAGPPTARAPRGWPEPPHSLCPSEPSRWKERCSYGPCYADKEESEFLHRCVAEGRSTHRMCICTS